MTGDCRDIRWSERCNRSPNHGRHRRVWRAGSMWSLPASPRIELQEHG
jgi:hypothetical protein